MEYSNAYTPRGSSLGYHAKRDEHASEVKDEGSCYGHGRGSRVPFTSHGYSINPYRPVERGWDVVDPVISAERWGSGAGGRKGKERDLDGGGESDGRKRRKTGVDESMQVAELGACVSEMIDLIRPYARTTSRPNPPRPPPNLSTHLQTLSLQISQHLHQLSLTSHPTLSPSLSTPFKRYTKSQPNSGTTAEEEMDVIRKRRQALLAKAAQATGNGNGSFALEKDEEGEGMGEEGLERCHGCGIGVTLEWRNGPDGPRSLCDSCGLHYERLAKKRLSDDKASGTGGNDTDGVYG